MSTEIGARNKLFSLAEARSLFVLIQTVTEKQCKALMPIQVRLNKMLSNDPRRSALEAEYEAVVSQWRTKIELLGAKVSGLWIVEFDVGEGHIAWRYPELSLNYFRNTGSAFAERVKLADYIDEFDPDWAS